MQERRVSGGGDEQQPLGNPPQPVQLADDDIDVLGELSVVAFDRAREQLGVTERDRDRRPQLVRGVLQEPPLVVEQPGVVLADHLVRPLGRQLAVRVPRHRQEHQGKQRVLGQLGGGLGADDDVIGDADRGHREHRAATHRVGPPVPGAEPVDERQARPDQVERDRLPVGEHDHEVEVDQGEDPPTRRRSRGPGTASRTAAGAAGAAGGAHSPPAQPRHKLIALTPHRLDQFEPELGADPPDAHVDHVRSRVEVVAPDRGEQLALGDRLPGVLRELAQQQELQPGAPALPMSATSRRRRAWASSARATSEA